MLVYDKSPSNLDVHYVQATFTYFLFSQIKHFWGFLGLARIEELLDMLNNTKILIVTELSRLGRSTAEVITLINELIKRDTRIIVIKQNMDIARHDMQSKVMVTLLSLFSELERDLISLRTKEALSAKKAQGKVLGKPKGTIQKSKFDKDVAKIKELLGYELSMRKIAKVLGYKSHSNRSDPHCL